ncbi:4-hydroxybenzoate 3-monooxygenase [Natronospirillum operosum]|uniref:4-hydroxybenzoate 3-monooxygenase n=1 Tax=Natronospirillum operosum TaxID=2759953 RepID=A0A4Z0WBU3_9GAMM|nr:4-hydroxybenzoate 3-monooxygenase [Natronospirillum operosum]TGG93393.1 4-hydroxybenzoate 3-monooxygenase [Natronospirillum operosum]
MTELETQVVVIGAGPAGLLLSRFLHDAGIRAVVLERRPMGYVLSRIRAGVLEPGSVDLLHQAGVGARLDREGQRHEGFAISYGEDLLRIDMQSLVGKSVTVYGQTEVTKDLYAAHQQNGCPLHDDVPDVAIEGLDTDRPVVTCTIDGEPTRIHCDLVAGCDGFHGVSRQSIPQAERHEYERVYPFGWLGILSETPPVDHELIYASHERGFALCSMRSNVLSRYYIQCKADDKPEQWSDEAFWDALKAHLPEHVAKTLVTGPSIEKSVAPLRSFVCEPMRYQRLFLAGDAAHIVPPTGAKGLNLAFSDVHYLSTALIEHYRDGSTRALDQYAERALARVWKAERFSWWMTSLLHRFEGDESFNERIRQAEFDYLVSSPRYQASLAENYVGLPF